jgi:hypothetical protein
VVLVLLAVVVVGVLAAVGLFVWAMSGGWDGLRGQAEPGDRKVVAARHAASGELDSLTTSTLRTVGGRELARVRYDQCVQGQNNWKIHDGFTLRCQLADSVVVAPDGEDVTSVAASLDAALVAGGWVQVGPRNEMTLPAEPDHSFLRSSRSGSYQRADDPSRLLQVGVTTRPDSPVTGDLPYDSSVPVEGDVSAYHQALQGARTARGDVQPRVVVHPSVRYFEDS